MGTFIRKVVSIAMRSLTIWSTAVAWSIFKTTKLWTGFLSEGFRIAFGIANALCKMSSAVNVCAAVNGELVPRNVKM